MSSSGKRNSDVNNGHASPARDPLPPQWAAGGHGSVVDRRSGLDRRDEPGNKNPGIDPATGLERRRSAGRRVSDFLKAAEEGQFTAEQFLFVKAMDEFKKANGCAFPTWTDVLEVIRLLGYRKTCKSELELRAAEDWREAADAPASVRPQRWAQREAIDRSRATTRREAA